ncbi:reverse transcriptase domain-containing protein [Tanacetum coccineum]
MKHSSSNDDTCFSIDVIDEILKEDFDALLDEGSKILYSIEGTLLEEEIFAEFDEFMALTADVKSDSESDTEELPFKKITVNTNYKIQTSLEEPPMDLELKPLPAHLLLLGKQQTFLVSPIHYVPKKGGITVVTNENDELGPTRAITGWRVCIDYHKLNKATAKDHFPLPFMDQMLERLAGNKYFCFLDGFSGYFQIPINLNDQEKTTFTCPFRTYAYRRMPFGLCNAPATFQRCMLAIFYDMIKESVEVFMNDFSVFGNSFNTCLNNLNKMLQRCKDAYLVLNWEKCHLMVKEGIVLGHKVSSEGLEVEKQRSIPNWNLPFELMCDASDFAVGAVLGQKDGKNFHPIYFASKTLNPAQQKYTVTEKELMAVNSKTEKELKMLQPTIYLESKMMKQMMTVKLMITFPARQEDPRESFDELMDTPLDFSAFMMNRLKVDTLTPKLLVGPTFELMKGTCKSLVELEYFFEEVYKATTEQLD